MVLRSPLGLAEPRCGGLPLRLRYFISPTDLISENEQTRLNCTPKVLAEHDLGCSVWVTVEKSANLNRMQLKPLVGKNGGGKEDFNDMNRQVDIETNF